MLASEKLVDDVGAEMGGVEYLLLLGLRRFMERRWCMVPRLYSTQMLGS